MHNKDEKDFKEVPQEGIDTVWKCFKMQVNRIPEREWLGSRDFKNYARGPYIWKTWTEINDIVECLARGYKHYDLLPKIENEGSWRFLGILSKNRWEWAAAELASVRQGGTTVAFYDTLGPSAVEYIIN